MNPVPRSQWLGKHLLLVALLLAPSLLAFVPLAPTAVASPTTCSARFGVITTTPMYADEGDIVTISVQVIDVNPLVDPQDTNAIRLNVKATYAGGAEALASTNLAPRQVPATFTATFTVAQGAAEGLGKFELRMLSGSDDPLQTGNNCSVAPSPQDQKEWGFYVGVKPDLHATGVRLMRHINGDDASPLGHQPIANDENYTRYQSVTGANACQESTLTQFSQFHLSVNVTNTGNADFRANAAGEGMPLSIRIQDGPEVLATRTFTLVINQSQTVTGLLFNGTVLSLVNKTGTRDIRVIVDVGNVYREGNETNNEFHSPAELGEVGVIHFRAPDLTGFLKDVKLDAEGKVTGVFRMHNEGNQRGGTAPSGGNAVGVCHSKNGGPVWARVYLDLIQADREIGNISESLGAAGTGLNETADQTFTSPNKLTAGAHEVILVVDAPPLPGGTGGNVNELNETNNIVRVPISLDDTRTPTLRSIAVGPSATRHVGDKINISGIVSDDSDFTLPGNNVFVEVTYPNGTAFNFTVLKQGSGDSGFAYVNQSADRENVTFWLNQSYPLEGDYAFQVLAEDSAGHTATSAVFGFTLTEYSKALLINPLTGKANVTIEMCRVTLFGQEVGLNCPQNQTAPNDTYQVGVDGNVTNVARITFEIERNSTGLDREGGNATRKYVRVTDPDGLVIGNYVVEPMCKNLLNQEVECPDDTGNVSETCTPTSTLCFIHKFRTKVGGGLSTPGVALPDSCFVIPTTPSNAFKKPSMYNLTIFIGDRACKFRAHGLPNMPFFEFDLWDTVNATTINVTPNANTNINALDSLTLRGEAYDNIRVKRVFAHVTRASTGEVVTQINLTGVNVIPVNGNGTYSRAIPTGLHTALDLAGAYNWLFGVVDANNTISYSSSNGTTCTKPGSGPQSVECTPVPRTFSILDTRRPSASDETAAFAEDGQPASDFQLGTEIVIQANADDDTRITVEVVVQSQTGAELLRRPMARVGDVGSLYRSANITTGPGGDLPDEGTFRFLVRVVDSVNQVFETPVSTFRLAGNLPPAFLNRQPGDGGFSGLATPVRVDISDNIHGVDRASIALRIGVNTPGEAATPVTPTLTDVNTRPSDGTPLVIRASFALPSTIEHGDRVTVEATATDLTNLTDTVRWTFTVDALAPRSTIACTRSHPAACGADGPQAVRGDTVFTLTAVDPDPDNKARSGIAVIRYALDVQGQTGSTVEAAATNVTFRLTDFVAQDGFYTLRYRAVDNAGNEEPEHRLVFALDSQGPLIQNVLTTPSAEGRNVTATISDAASEVRSATLFYRSGATSFQSTPMVRLPETNFWSGVIPGARRGVQVCYYLEAVDHLDNVGVNGTAIDPRCFSSENHPPQLQVLSPRDGEDVGSSMTVRWQVSDIDGDPVTVSVSYRRSGDVQFIPLPLTSQEQGSRTKLVDTSSFVPGAHVLRVEAADNQAFNNRTIVTVQFSVGGEGGTLGQPQFPTTVNVGQGLTVRVEIARAVLDVEAVLLRGDTIVQRQVMEQNPPGSRTWEATFQVNDPGVYQVQVRGTYEDGTPFVIQGASPVTVTGGGLGGLDQVAILVLGAAVVALAALGMHRRGWL